MKSVGWLLLLIPWVSSQLITYMNYSSSTIPYASSIGAPSNLLCFTGWSLIQSAEGMTIFCNDTITNIVWQMNAPGGGMVRNDPLPEPAFNWTIPYVPTGVWYVFGDCTFEIIQCNTTVPHNYSEEKDEYKEGCPSNIVATYYSCTNAAIVNINLQPKDGILAFPTGNPDVWMYNDILPTPPCNNSILPIDIYLHSNSLETFQSVIAMVADIAILPMIAIFLIVVLYLVWVFVLRRPKYDNVHSSIEMSNV